MYRCPVKIVVFDNANQGNTPNEGVIETRRVIYRQYDGLYYCRLDGMKLHAKLTHNGDGFIVRLSKRQALVCFGRLIEPLLTKELHNVC